MAQATLFLVLGGPPDVVSLFRKQYCHWSVYYRHHNSSHIQWSAKTIENARITNTINTVFAYQAAFHTYQQSYGSLPGDDEVAPSRFPKALLASQHGNGDVDLQGTFDLTNPLEETRLVWAHLRAAGLVKDSQGNGKILSDQPPNPFNGIYGFQREVLRILSILSYCA